MAIRIKRDSVSFKLLGIPGNANVWNLIKIVKRHRYVTDCYHDYSGGNIVLYVVHEWKDIRTIVNSIAAIQKAVEKYQEAYNENTDK